MSLEGNNTPYCGDTVNGRSPKTPELMCISRNLGCCNNLSWESFVLQIGTMESGPLSIMVTKSPGFRLSFGRSRYGVRIIARPTVNDTITVIGIDGVVATNLWNTFVPPVSREMIISRIHTTKEIDWIVPLDSTAISALLVFSGAK